MLTGIEHRRRKFIPSFLLTPDAHLPDEVIIGFTAEPHLQHPTDAEPLVLPPEHAPCALQPKPELHKAFFIILNDIHDIMTFMTTTLISKL